MAFVSPEGIADKLDASAPRRHVRVQSNPALPREDGNHSGARRREDAGQGRLPAPRHDARSGKRIVRNCGFGSEETMRRSFLRQMAVAPNDYRVRFSSAAPSRAAPPGARPVTRRIRRIHQSGKNSGDTLSMRPGQAQTPVKT
jgi:AraC-like DNA-binding protein